MEWFMKKKDNMKNIHLGSTKFYSQHFNVISDSNFFGQHPSKMHRVDDYVFVNGSV